MAFASDTDADRHGIVSAVTGSSIESVSLSCHLLLVHNRPQWCGGRRQEDRCQQQHDRSRGKLDRRLFTSSGDQVSSSQDSSTATRIWRQESKGATFLRRDGTVWTG